MCCKRAGGEPGWPGTQNTGTELHVSKQAKVSEPQQTMKQSPHSGRNSSSPKSLQQCTQLYSIKRAPSFKVSEAAPLSCVTENPITDHTLGLPPVESVRLSGIAAPGSTAGGGCWNARKGLARSRVREALLQLSNARQAAGAESQQIWLLGATISNSSWAICLGCLPKGL